MDVISSRDPYCIGWPDRHFAFLADCSASIDPLLLSIRLLSAANFLVGFFSWVPEFHIFFLSSLLPIENSEEPTILTSHSRIFRFLMQILGSNAKQRPYPWILSSDFRSLFSFPSALLLAIWSKSLRVFSLIDILNILFDLTDRRLHPPPQI